MKKFKNTSIKVEPAKPEPIKIIPKPASPQNNALKPEVPKVILTKPDMPPPAGVKAEGPKVGRVSLELVKPEARKVCVAGSFNDWSPERAPLVSKGNGRWVTDLTLKPGRHEYLFVVDGQWIPDPNARESVQNPFGGRNSILGVSE